MKSEERHEMETNVLAKWLVEAGNKVQPYTTHLGYGLLALVAAVVLWNLSSGVVGSKDQAGWDAYVVATLPGKFDAEQLKTVADSFAGKPVGELAQLGWADGQLTNACRSFLSDKKYATELLEDAEEIYVLLAADGGEGAIRGRAQLGHARVLELRGEIESAITAYNKVEGLFAELATARAKQLEELGTKDYSKWLAAAEGSRTASNLGAGGLPQFRPQDLGLPAEGSDPSSSANSEEFRKMLDRFQKEAPDEGTDRYEEPASDTETADESSVESGSESSAEAGPVEETPAP